MEGRPVLLLLWCLLLLVMGVQSVRCGIPAGHAVRLGLLEARRLVICTRAHSPTSASADTCGWRTHQTVTSRTIILRHTKQPPPPSPRGPINTRCFYTPASQSSPQYSICIGSLCKGCGCLLCQSRVSMVAQMAQHLAPHRYATKHRLHISTCQEVRGTLLVQYHCWCQYDGN